MTETKQNVFIEKTPKVTLKDVVLDDETSRRLQKVVLENQNRERLLSHGLQPRRRLLFYGSPGTGKTFSGEALAGELDRKFYIFNLESLASGSGDSALRTLAYAFEFICENTAIFLFDEFDAIAANRGSQGAGDGRRIVNDLLVHFETFTGGAILICATNLLDCVDGAFRRRFDTICRFDLPTREERQDMITRAITRYSLEARPLEVHAILDSTQGLSLHEAESVIENAAKTAILANSKTLALQEEIRGILDRKDAFKKSFEYKE